MTTLSRIKLWLLGRRDYPEAVVTLPEHLVADLPDLIARARAFNPALPTDSVVQAIWRLGSYRLGQNLLRRIPLNVAELPPPGRGLNADHPEDVPAQSGGEEGWNAAAFRPSTGQVPRRRCCLRGRRGVR